MWQNYRYRQHTLWSYYMRYLQYHVYGWSLPLFIASFAVAVNQTFVRFNKEFSFGKRLHENEIIIINQSIEYQ